MRLANGRVAGAVGRVREVPATTSSEMSLVIRSTAPVPKLFLTATNGGKTVQRTLISRDVPGGESILIYLRNLLPPGDNMVTLVGESPDEPSVSWWGHLVIPGP